MVTLLGPSYPKKIWTKFEFDQFKSRLGQDAVIPIWFTTSPAGMFDETRRYGGLTIDPEKDVSTQVSTIASLLVKKLADVRGRLFATD